MDLRRLRMRHLEVVVLVGRDGLTYREAGKRLGITRMTARQYTYEVARTLRRVEAFNGLTPRERAAKLWAEHEELVRQLARARNGKLPPGGGG